MADKYVYQIIHQGNARGQMILNISHWMVDPEGANPPDTADLNNLALQVDARYAANVVNHLNLTYTYARTVLREVIGWDQLPPPPGTPSLGKHLVFNRLRIESANGGLVGGDAGPESLPLTVTAVCHWDTGLAGRTRRGRWKLSPFSENDSSGDQMDLVQWQNLDPTLANYRAPVTTVPGNKVFKMVVLSTTRLFAMEKPGVPRDAASFVTDHTLSLTWGVQRSRKYNTVPR